MVAIAKSFKGLIKILRRRVNINYIQNFNDVASAVPCAEENKGGNGEIATRLLFPFVPSNQYLPG